MSKQKQITTAEIRKKKVAELHTMLKATVKILAKGRMEINTKKTKNTSGMRANRKLIAHIKTVLAEKRLLQKVEAK
ncbi:MAG: 50S ribosomal protein L29 [Patescibacteria group bacterium]|jgi:ribosomal protein L29